MWKKWKHYLLYVQWLHNCPLISNNNYLMLNLWAQKLNIAHFVTQAYNHILHVYSPTDLISPHSHTCNTKELIYNNSLNTITVWVWTAKSTLKIIDHASLRKQPTFVWSHLWFPRILTIYFLLTLLNFFSVLYLL